MSTRDSTTTRNVTVNAYCSTSRERPPHWGWTSFLSKLTRPKNRLNPSATYHWFLESELSAVLDRLLLAEQRSPRMSAIARADALALTALPLEPPAPFLTHMFFG